MANTNYQSRSYELETAPKEQRAHKIKLISLYQEAQVKAPPHSLQKDLLQILIFESLGTPIRPSLLLTHLRYLVHTLKIDYLFEAISCELEASSLYLNSKMALRKWQSSVAVVGVVQRRKQYYDDVRTRNRRIIQHGSLTTPKEHSLPIEAIDELRHAIHRILLNQANAQEPIQSEEALI